MPGISLGYVTPDECRHVRVRWRYGWAADYRAQLAVARGWRAGQGGAVECEPPLWLFDVADMTYWRREAA